MRDLLMIFSPFLKKIAKIVQCSCRFVLKLDLQEKEGRKEKKSKEARKRSRVLTKCYWKFINKVQKMLSNSKNMKNIAKTKNYNSQICVGF